METVIQILMLFIVVNTVLKLSFWKWWQAALFGLACGIFVVVSCKYAVLQSKTQLVDYLTDKAIVQDVAVLVTIETALCLAFCFSALKKIPGKKPKLWSKVLDGYPSLLVFPVLFYLLTLSVYAMPGSDFTDISYVLAGAVLIAMPLSGYAIRRLFPEGELRLEVHFLVSLLVCLIGLIATVNGNVTYAGAKEPVSAKAIFASIGLFLVLFFTGIACNKLKWNIVNKKQKYRIKNGNHF